MKNLVLSGMGAAALTVLLAVAPVAASDGKTHDHNHDHDHAHAHEQDGKTIAKGYFDDSQIAARSLSDWQGDWQSVFPHLAGGALDEVMAHKAEHGDKTAAEYRAYYQTGYATDVDRIVIADDFVTFFRDGQPQSARYVEDGYEILTYEKGNRGVRFIFRKAEGQAGAPDYIQFSDHIIAPQKSGHFHLYWGDDRAKILEELTNWPTYYPASLSAAEIAHEMIAH